MIRSSRKSRGLSQEALAEIAGVNRSYLSKIERGTAIPTIVTAQKVAEALGESLSSLISLCEEDG